MAAASMFQGRSSSHQARSKAARASCLTFSLLVVFVCQLKKSHRTKVRVHSLILPYQLPHRRIQPVERERIHPPGTVISRSQPFS